MSESFRTKYLANVCRSSHFHFTSTLLFVIFNQLFLTFLAPSILQGFQIFLLLLSLKVCQLFTSYHLQPHVPSFSRTKSLANVYWSLRFYFNCVCASSILFAIFTSRSQAFKDQVPGKCLQMFSLSFYLGMRQFSTVCRLQPAVFNSSRTKYCASVFIS